MSYNKLHNPYNIPEHDLKEIRDLKAQITERVQALYEILAKTRGVKPTVLVTYTFSVTAEDERSTDHGDPKVVNRELKYMFGGGGICDTATGHGIVSFDPPGVSYGFEC